MQKEKNTPQIDCSKMFDNKALVVLGSGDVQSMLKAMEQIYQDAFVYGHSCGILNGVPSDYNMLTYQERCDINVLYVSVTSLLTVISKYGFEIWVNAQVKEKVLLNKVDADEIRNLFSNISNLDKYLKYFDEMVMISVLYKLISLEESPTQQTGELYSLANSIKAILCGYTERRILAKA